jgi:23S rRNA (uracil1939-C5)-methyltransferase
LAGKSQLEDKIGPHSFQISANSFFQTNSLGAQRLYGTVVDYAQFKGNEIVLDLYSGTGTIPIFLASRVGSVTGIEISESAVQDAWKNCEKNGIDNCRFICGDIRKELPAMIQKPDVLIIDPPRAGMHKDVLAQVLAMAPKKIIYVSCNPATMARDMGQMSQDYEIVEIQPVDMFPHTYHIEAVAKMRLKKKEGK